ncbi:MAG: SPOR domain-containing protein, partial [Caulobacteraceae bacterium]
KVKTQKDFVRYDCLQRRTATLVEKSYLADGQETASVTAAALQWEAVSEHTVGDDSLSFACNFLAQAALRTPTSPLKFDERTYVRADADKPQSPPSEPKAAEATLSHGVPFRVQIAAAPTWQAAQHLLSALQRNHAGLLIGRDTKIEKSVVAAGVAFRVTIGGARSFGEALKFCKALRLAGLQCFVRESPS